MPAKLLLLDGHSLAYRAFFALPLENFSTTTGQPTNAVFGFTSMLINVLRDEQPTHIGVAFDVSRQTFRLEEYAEYKAGRNKTPGEFSSQLPLIEEVLTAMRIPFLKKEGYEADDIIATLVTQALAEGSGVDDVLILTGDRDSIQLVTDRSTVLYPMRGVSDLARMTPAYVQDRYGIPPERYPELAALVGETSDNLPGVPGRRPGLRRQVAQPVRRPRQRHHPRRRDHRQEGRGAARAPRRRDPQPPAQRAGHRPRPRGRSGRPGLAVLGPAGGAHALRRPRVRGAPHPAARGAARPRRRRRSTTPGSTSRCGCSTTGELAGWLAEHASAR